MSEDIRCDCHGNVKLAERTPDGKIVIITKRHGEKHRVVIDARKASKDTRNSKG